jgi:hypothetical protein
VGDLLERFRQRALTDEVIDAFVEELSLGLAVDADLIEHTP